MSLRDLPLETLAEMLPELKQRRVLAERMQRYLRFDHDGNRALGKDYGRVTG
jgi:hypothetical protein